MSLNKALLLPVNRTGPWTIFLIIPEWQRCSFSWILQHECRALYVSTAEILIIEYTIQFLDYDIL
jgi:hypothetical protein